MPWWETMLTLTGLLVKNSILCLIAIATVSALHITSALAEELEVLNLGGKYSGSGEVANFKRRLEAGKRPVRYVEAVQRLGEIVKSLDTSVLEHGEIPLADAVVRSWRLDDWNTPLAREMIFLGAVTSQTMARILMGEAAELESSQSTDLISLKRQLLMYRLDDGLSPAPLVCGNTPPISEGRSRVVVSEFSRIVHWVACQDGKTHLYLPERGFFDGDELLSTICQGQTGGVPPACERVLE